MSKTITIAIDSYDLTTVFASMLYAKQEVAGASDDVARAIDNIGPQLLGQITAEEYLAAVEALTP